MDNIQNPIREKVMKFAERSGFCGCCRREIIGRPIIVKRRVPSADGMEKLAELELCSEECKMGEEISWHIIVLGIHDFEELIDHLVNEHGYDRELIEKGFTRVQEALDLLKYL
jgi:hypothetical protein